MFSRVLKILSFSRLPIHVFAVIVRWRTQMFVCFLMRQHRRHFRWTKNNKIEKKRVLIVATEHFAGSFERRKCFITENSGWLNETCLLLIVKCATGADPERWDSLSRLSFKRLLAESFGTEAYLLRSKNLRD